MRRTHANGALLVGVVAILLVAGRLACGETISIVATRDNTLYQDANGRLSDGAGSFLFAGVTAQNQIRRGLVFFDVASNIPADATINSVELTLFASRVPNSSARSVGLHRTLNNWGEGTSNADAQEGKGATATPGDATWLHAFYNSEFWTTVGGDFSAMPSAVRSITNIGSYTWSSTAQLVADVHSWLDDPATNFGWTIVGNEATTTTAKRFDSHESVVAQRRPQLTIDFTPAPSLLEGDYNENGVVDAADYVVWRKNDGAQANYDIWRVHFGIALGAGSGSADPLSRVPRSTESLSADVPEPATWMLLACAATELGVFSTRRPRRLRIG